MNYNLKLRVHSQIVHDKAVNVRLFLKHLTHGLTCTMSCFAIDTDKRRIRSVITFLQGSCKFE